MRKTTILVDDVLIERAGAILGTRGLKATIERALEEVIAADARQALIRRLETLDGLDLADPEIMREAWRD